jgi:hypothetical protein
MIRLRRAALSFGVLACAAVTFCPTPASASALPPEACLGGGHCVTFDESKDGAFSTEIDGGLAGQISGGLSAGHLDTFSAETYNERETCQWTLERRATGTWGSESEPGEIVCRSEESGAVTFESPIWIQPTPKEKPEKEKKEKPSKEKASKKQLVFDGHALGTGETLPGVKVTLEISSGSESQSCTAAATSWESAIGIKSKTTLSSNGVHGCRVPAGELSIGDETMLAESFSYRQNGKQFRTWHVFFEATVQAQIQVSTQSCLYQDSEWPAGLGTTESKVTFETAQTTLVERAPIIDHAAGPGSSCATEPEVQATITIPGLTE